MMLLNYKNESSTNVSKYCRLAIYLANTKHFCGNSILQFFKTAEFLGNIQYKSIWQGIKLSDLWSEKSDSQTVNIQIVKSFLRPKD